MEKMMATASLKTRVGPGRSRAQDIDRYVGARMRERRIMLGLTQQQMAELIGVTYQQAHKYEKGINRIAAGRLFTIAQALGVDVGYFFDGMDSERRVQADAAAADAARARAQFHQHAQPQAPGGDLQSRPGIVRTRSLVAEPETELGLDAAPLAHPIRPASPEHACASGGRSRRRPAPRRRDRASCHVYAPTLPHGALPC